MDKMKNGNNFNRVLAGPIRVFLGQGAGFPGIFFSEKFFKEGVVEGMARFFNDHMTDNGHAD